MSHRLNKGKLNFTYAGAPKSYWEFATKSSVLPSSVKESDASKQKRLERDKRLKEMEDAAMRKKRLR